MAQYADNQVAVLLVAAAMTTTLLPVAFAGTSSPTTDVHVPEDATRIIGPEGAFSDNPTPPGPSADCPVLEDGSVCEEVEPFSATGVCPNPAARERGEPCWESIQGGRAENRTVTLDVGTTEEGADEDDTVVEVVETVENHRPVPSVVGHDPANGDVEFRVDDLRQGSVQATELVENRLYLATTNYVTAIDVQNGEPVWTHTVGADGQRQVVDATLGASGDGVYVLLSQSLRALDAAEGTVEWKQAVDLDDASAQVGASVDVVTVAHSLGSQHYSAGNGVLLSEYRAETSGAVDAVGAGKTTITVHERRAKIDGWVAARVSVYQGGEQTTTFSVADADTSFEPVDAALEDRQIQLFGESVPAGEDAQDSASVVSLFTLDGEQVNRFALGGNDGTTSAPAGFAVSDDNVLVAANVDGDTEFTVFARPSSDTDTWRYTHEGVRTLSAALDGDDVVTGGTCDDDCTEGGWFGEEEIDREEIDRSASCSVNDCGGSSISSKFQYRTDQPVSS
jgi:hypothetical protein